MTETTASTSMTHKEVAEYIANQDTDRRGGFIARPILLQKLNEFGAPNLAVLTFESEKTLTLAGLLPLEANDEVVLYDDNAPDGAQSFYGIVEDVREGVRPTDAIKGMRLIYLQKKSSERVETPKEA